jgi:sulfur carrier protein
MVISVNGEPLTIASDCTVTELLTQLGLAGKTVAVERNRAIVPRAQHEITRLHPDDQLEVVTFVGGG